MTALGILSWGGGKQGSTGNKSTKGEGGPVPAGSPAPGWSWVLKQPHSSPLPLRPSLVTVLLVWNAVLPHD
jgi:hypothetical protein